MIGASYYKNYEDVDRLIEYMYAQGNVDKAFCKDCVKHVFESVPIRFMLVNLFHYKPDYWVEQYKATIPYINGQVNLICGKLYRMCYRF